jgi:hypothetical protein
MRLRRIALSLRHSRIRVAVLRGRAVRSGH